MAAISLSAGLLSGSAGIALIAFAGVGVGYSTIVPIIYSAAGKIPNIASGIALSIVSTIGYFGILLAPPVIGFAAELINLRIALGLIPLLSVMIVLISFGLRDGE